MKDLGKQIQAEVVARLDWIGIPQKASDDIRLLDYACGSGELSRVSNSAGEPQQLSRGLCWSDPVFVCERSEGH